MTVTTDIATAAASERYVYLAIDGLEPLLFQRGDRTPPSTWSRSVKTCLHAPEEQSIELDLGEMEPSLSGMTFWLDNVLNADRTSFFGQLFAPNAWASVNHARVQAGLVHTNNIPANAATIPVKATADFTAPGNAYLGQEMVNYSGITATSFTNVTKGINPCVNVGQTYGWTVDRPPDGAHGFSFHVGKVPFAFFGRRVAMYLITWDRMINDWRPQAESRLVWAGRISDRIIRDGKKGWWKLSCKSVLDELKNKVFRTGGEEKLTGINQSGPLGGKVDVTIQSSTGNAVWYTVYGVELAPSGFYDGYQPFFTDVNKQLAALQFKIPEVQLSIKEAVNGQVVLSGLNFIPAAAGGSDAYTVTMVPAKGNGDFCHALNALGFDGKKGLKLEVPKGVGTTTASYYYIYQPHDRQANGAKIHLAKVGNFPAPQIVESQGDQGAAIQRAYIMIEKATLDAVGKEEGAYFGSYTGKSAGFPATLTLSNEPVKLESFSAFSGTTFGTAPWNGPAVQQVLIPAYKEVKRTRGPFEMLLNMLVSTGTPGYNGTYDVYPSGWGLAIQQELVDEQSFLDADKSVLSSPLAQRKTYIIRSGESWIELAKRELKLFGYAVVWRLGKITIRRVLDVNVDEFTVTIDESSRAGHDMPDTDMGQSVVINQYRAEVVFDQKTGKYGAPYDIVDADSTMGTGVAKRVSVKHPGIYASSDIKQSTADKISALLKTELLGRFIRYTSAVVQVTLGPTLEDRVFVGDKVKIVSSTLMDLEGAGTLGLTAFCTVIKRDWSWKKHTGSAVLLVHDFSKQGVAFAPSAKVDLMQANAGWNDVTKNMVLVGHEYGLTTVHDGQAVVGQPGWKVTLTELAPTDPTAAQTFGPLNAVAYHSGNSALVLAPGTTLAGWDNTKEYSVSFTPYSQINTKQADDDGVSSGIWAANVSTESIQGVLPYKWG